MEDNDDVSYLESLKRKKEKSYNFKLGTMIFSTVTLAILGLGGLMALAGQVSADADMSYLQKNFGANEDYLGEVEFKRYQLVRAFSNGEIDYEEYKRACDFLYSGEFLVNYMQNSNDVELNSKVQSYVKTKNFTDTIVHKGLPVYAGATGLGVASYVIADAIDRKYRSKLAGANKEDGDFCK